MSITHADYFAGIGGFSLGARWAGIETVYWCENNELQFPLVAMLFARRWRKCVLNL